MIRINLLETERAPGKKKAAGTPGATQLYLMLGVFVVGALGVCSVGWWIKSSSIKELDAQTAQVQKRKQELDKIAQEVAKFEAQKKLLEQKLATIATLKAQQSERDPPPRRDLEGLAGLRLAGQLPANRQRPPLRRQEQQPQRSRGFPGEPAERDAPAAPARRSEALYRHRAAGLLILHGRPGQHHRKGPCGEFHPQRQLPAAAAPEGRGHRSG